MLTIPTAWKRGSADRDVWYNNRGTPMYFIRITPEDRAQIRLATKTTMFQEEGGTERLYESDYLQGVPSISQKVNMGDDTVGAVGEMGTTTLTINNGKVGSYNFLEHHSLELDDLVNAIVDMWICFWEVENVQPGYHPSTDRFGITTSLKMYTGRIANYSYHGAEIVLTIEDWAVIHDREMPLTLTDLKNKYGAAMTILDKMTNAVVPLCFGKGWFVIQPACNADGSTIQYELILGWPITSAITNEHMGYWDAQSNQYVIFGSPYYTISYNAARYYSAATMKLLYDLHPDFKQWKIISPKSITELMPRANSVEKAWIDGSVNTENFIDNITSNKMFAYVLVGDLTPYYTWVPCWTLNFDKEEFPEDEPFNLYMITDVTFHGTTATGNFSLRFAPSIGTWLLPQLSDTASTILTGAEIKIASRYWANCFQEAFQDAKYNRTHNPLVLLMEQDEVGDTIPDNGFSIDIEGRNDAGVATGFSMAGHEAAIFLVHLMPQTKMAIHGTYPTGTIQDAINLVIDYFADLDSSIYVSYINFLQNYVFGGEVQELTTIYDFFCEIAKQCGLMFVETAEGKWKFIDLYGGSRTLYPLDYTVTDDDILMDDTGVEIISFSKLQREVYNAFDLQWDKNHANGEFDKTTYLSASDHNLTVLTAAEIDQMKQWCNEAATKYGAKKKLRLTCEFIGHDTAICQQTSEEYLFRAVEWFTHKPTIVNFTTSLRMIDLEVGDSIAFGLDLYTSTHDFIVISKKIDNTGRTIEFECIETRWGA